MNKIVSGLCRAGARIPKFVREQSGSALIYMTISLPVLIGFALLAIDGSRLMHLHTSLQQAADGLALNAAAELDRSDDSLERAKLAIQTMLQNRQRLGDSGGAIVECPNDSDCDVTGRFLTGLPLDDATTIDAWIAEDSTRLIAYLSENLAGHARSAEARFVEITVNPQGLSTILPASYLGGSNSALASASAIAGYNKGSCYSAPIMMCNPFEGATPSLEDFVADPTFRRRMIEVRQVGPGAGYFPGNFTFLKADSPGGNELRDALACIDRTSCISEDGVDTEPGQNMGPARVGINVRFDMYNPPLHQPAFRDNPDCRPARNVRKGYFDMGGGGNNGGGNNGGGNNGGGNNGGGNNGGGGGAPGVCVPSDENDAVNYQGFPRDQSPSTDLTDAQGNVVGRIYAGDWDFDTYWNVNFNHGGTPIAAPNAWSSADPPPRYDVYRCELGDFPGCTNDMTNETSVGGEIGAPQCYSGATSDEPDRRLLNVAVVNCNAVGPLQGRETKVPVYKFVKAFLIRPLSTTGGDSIDLEFVEVLDPVSDYQARDTVQLYR